MIKDTVSDNISFKIWGELITITTEQSAKSLGLDVRRGKGRRLLVQKKVRYVE